MRPDGGTCTCPADLSVPPPHYRLLEEILRYSCACTLARQLAELVADNLPAGSDSRGLMTGAIFEGQQWDAAHAAEVGDSRDWVHPVLDVHCGAKVRDSVCGATGTLVGIKLTKGNVLAQLRNDDEGQSTLSFPIAQMRLVEREPLRRDALLPALECIGTGSAARSTVNWFFEKLCSVPTKMQTSFNVKRRQAWALAERVMVLFYEARCRLWALVEDLRQAPPGAISVYRIALVKNTSDTETLQIHIRDGTERKWFRAITESNPIYIKALLDGEASDCLSMNVRAADVVRLRGRAACLDADHFAVALALLLLRYAGLSGCAWQSESGWHAGLPPAVFDALVAAFGVTAECFASPLNSTLPRYYSVFPDTDRFFGGLGNFFDPSVLACGAEGLSLEANPPFDHTVIAASLARALKCLEEAPAEVPVTFVFVLPDSAQTNAVAVRRDAEQSRFCRASCVIEPGLAPYVHGARHVAGRREKRRRDGDAAYLVTLSCATRLLVLQSDAAAAARSAAEGLAKVRDAWAALSPTEEL